MCMSTREIIIFLAGAQTFHVISHIVLGASGVLPLRLFAMKWTKQLNRIAIIVNIAVMVGLLWWASQLP